MNNNRTPMTMLALGAIWLLASSASADVIRLADGRLMQGEITEHSQDGIQFRRWDNDGVVELPWSLLLPADELKLKKSLGYIIETDESQLDIDAIQVLLTNGSMLTGLEDASDSTESTFALRSVGTILKLDREQIDSIHPTRLPILQVLADDEIYEYLLSQFDPQDPEGHYRLGDALMKAFTFDKAKEHFETAIATGGPTYEQYAGDRLAQCEVAIANAEVEGKLRKIEVEIAQHRYVAASDSVEALALEYEGTGKFEMGTEEERGPGLLLLARILDERDQWLKSEVARLFYLEMRIIGEDFVAGRLESWKKSLEESGVIGNKRVKPGFSDVQGFARGQMMQEILTRVTARLGLPTVETKLVASLTLDATEVTLASASDLPEPGDPSFPDTAQFLIKIDDEYIEYGRIAGRRLLDCKRGVNGSQPRSHDKNAMAVFATDAQTEAKFRIDVRPYFDARKKTNHRSSYGSGTYIVDMRGREIVKGDQVGKKKQESKGGDAGELRKQLRGGTGGGGGSKVTDPEEWWAAQQTSGRRSWIIAYFAENNLIVTDVDYNTCSTCGGRGALTLYTQSGSSSRICNRCSGAGADRTISFY